MPKARPMPKLSWPPHVSGRDGRPRFQPGPELRAMGFRGRDLKTPEGQWMTVGEAHDAMGPVIREIETARARAREVSESTRRRDARKRQLEWADRNAQSKATGLTVGQLIEAFIGDHEEDNAASRKRGVTPQISPTTLRDYKHKLRRVLALYPVFRDSPACIVTRPVVRKLYRKMFKEHGPSCANGWCRCLAAAFSFGIGDSDDDTTAALVPHEVNPFSKLRMKQTRGRKVAASTAEVRHMIAVADRIGRADVGDMIMLGIATALRPGDRISLPVDAVVNGRLIHATSKTEAVADLPVLEPLAARLAAAAARRADWRVRPTTLMADERLRRPWSKERMAKAFAHVRAAAVIGVPASPEGPAIAAMPTCGRLENRDMRATTITWLREAGATVEDIVTISGHSLTGANQLLDRHYMRQSQAQANAAMERIAKRVKDASGT